MKREPVKYIWDAAKARYNKGTECYICGATEDLDFHHYNSISEMCKRWMMKNKYTPQQAVDNREQFIEEHHTQMYEDTVTLCNTHHTTLHKIYGVHPSLGTAKKQARWVERQRAKHGLV